MALGAGNVWANEVPQGSLGGEPGPQDTVLLHWNGKTWSRAAKDTGLDLDGHDRGRDRRPVAVRL